MARRFVLYGVASTVFAFGVVSTALRTRANFYAAAVSIGKSSGSMMILGNFTLFNAILLGIGVKNLFFGQLRTIEYEHLWEKLWMFLTESLLALAIFRDDFSISFMAMFSVLVFLKCFHWITADRVDYMDQIPPPGPPRQFHIRMVSIISLLMLLDFLFVSYSLETILLEGVSAMIIFASEFIILQATIAGSAARYAVGVIDLRRARGREDAPVWEAKSTYLFYIDLSVDFVKLLTYLMFFTVIFLNYGLPLHILRDVYLTFMSFMGRIRDLMRYRRATRDMDNLYPDATEEELERSGDRTCIICREEMISRNQREREGMQVNEGGPNETPKKLQCGHVFHFHCLRSWLERQQKCPTCRRDVLTRQRPPGLVYNPPMPQEPLRPAPAARPGDHGRDAQLVELMRQNLNEYFPNDNNNRRDGAARISTTQGTNSRAGESSGSQEGTEQRIQRGIWGGPIVPGRFTPAPLGAAPRISSPSTPFTLHRSGQATPTRTVPQIFANQQEDNDNLPSNPRIPQDSPSYYNNSRVVSGNVTPFSSNPPFSFSNTGAARATREEAGQDDNDVRRQVADAALRRLGGMTGSGESLPSVREDKGKEREHMQEENELDRWDAVPRVHAQLAPKQFHALDHDHLSRSNKRPKLDSSAAYTPPFENWTQRIERTSDGTRRGLDERLKLLGQVDERIWGLVGELTRLRSEWEAEDGAVSGTSSRSRSSPGEGAAAPVAASSVSDPPRGDDSGVEQ
ncbi:hypothetical protein CNBL1240 [Cryptococcus deneoformans B-3501A]|uniref:hypothetical protein n=1 Tax=Cryptococcus deneoformans (strain B-3501A) TaxID=283643 RepID=UPI0000430252|nr:hypothetical protein CNBL1240 [Cryptococcus neoformans var. neoformans B-3501A]EAL17862.1 hypothetical protein CNBL1240 [Cryptococcus neoformans var. neoformans B-3501A]